MLDFPRWKVWSITLTILVGIFFVIPSLLPQAAKDKWPSWLPKETISLGQDLAGGGCTEGHDRPVRIGRSLVAFADLGHPSSSVLRARSPALVQ